MKKNKTSLGYIVLGILSILCGISTYSSGWDFKYQQPTSKLGSIALICFGVVLLAFEFTKFIKIIINSKKHE